MHAKLRVFFKVGVMGPIEFLAEDWWTQRHTLCSRLAEIDFTAQFRTALLLMVTVAVVSTTGVQKPQVS